MVSIQGLKDNDGKDKGHRVVEFKTRSEATKARKTLNNRELKGRPIHIVEFKEDLRKESLEFVSRIIQETIGPMRPTIILGTPSSSPNQEQDPPLPSPQPIRTYYEIGGQKVQLQV